MSDTRDNGSRDIANLLAIMATLRNPDGGCPWDLAQDFSTIAPYTIEEAYEVADAIDRGDLADLKDELGDLLLQVVFHAQMASEQGAFDFGDVVAAICDKMTRRHPHVFGDEARRDNADSQLQHKAARVGFDWPGPAPVLEKLHEEIEEVRAEFAAVAAAPDDADAHDRLEDELGDILFVCANLARHAKVDVGSALRRANLKFERRFRAMEAMAAADGGLAGQSLEAQDRYWDRAKVAEKEAGK